jgi:glycerol-3-phosphate dehydrogenase
MMYRPEQREEIWNTLQQPWDIMVIGGGITGAGIFNAAAREGLKVLLVEASDYAFGTSSRSSKLVHGGFRYLKNRQFNVTRESVRERERLLRQAKYLVTPLYFLLPSLGFSRATRQVFRLGVTIYDLLAPKWAHGDLSPKQIHRICPQLTNDRLNAGFYYYDAEVDDARLVLRVIQEGIAAGGTAMNYTSAEKLLFQQNGQVAGALLRDNAPSGNGQSAEVFARVVINATGPWSDELRGQVDQPPRIRKQRGSHLIFPWSKLPLAQAITLLHPRDKRAMFVFPWEGVTVIGTTDLDHPRELEMQHPEPAITTDEVGYILEAVTYLFTDSQLGREDVLSSISGLRPIVTSGENNPSKESRAHVLWNERGLLTITGGKLTTYRLMAYETLESCRTVLSGAPILNKDQPLLNQAPVHKVKGVADPTWHRLLGRYGQMAKELAGVCQDEELASVEGLPALWAELRWGARCESVHHLDDLLLRRTRMGLTTKEGGFGVMERIREIAQPELQWDDSTWKFEVDRYRKLWKECYSLPIELDK